MNPLVQVVIAVVGLLGAGGGILGMVTARATRRKIIAESKQIKAQADASVASTVKVLLGSAEDLVEPLKRELREARSELREARSDVTALRGQVEDLGGQVDDLGDTVRRLHRAIRDPYITVDRLRAMIPADPGGVR